MIISTYNTNSIRSRLEGILQWLGQNNPDILCLQETKVQDGDFPAEPFFDRGYHLIFHGQKQYNGVAIVSRFPIEEALTGLPGDDLQEARFLRARIGPYSIVNTYVPQGRSRDSDKFLYKLDWFRRLKGFFQESLEKDEKIIWTGDLNVARTEIDVYDPERLWGHVCFCEEVQQVFEEVLELGFTDVFRLFHPEPGNYTFLDYKVPNGFKRNRGWRLDYILCDASTAQACKDCRIDTTARAGEKPSDHTYVIAEFEEKS